MKTIKFPKLPKKQSNNQDNTTNQQNLEYLDNWVHNIPHSRTKNISSQNISFLYKQISKNNIRRTKFMVDSTIAQVGLFLATLDQQLEKIKNFDYISIYQNMEYCSGFYQNQFNNLLKKIKQYRQSIQKKYNQGLGYVKQSRINHINMMQQSVETYKDKIKQVRQQIEENQKDLKPFKKIIKNLDIKKQYILKYCLGLGYDVRKQGLVWILKQLKKIPKRSQFPNFLNERQINFIISKFNNQVNIQNLQEVKQNKKIGQSFLEAYGNLNRKKRRQLSTILENQVQKKLQSQNAYKLGIVQKYLNQDTIRLFEGINNSKITKYQIIYKETQRKLKQVCADVIHGRIIKRKSSNNTQKLIQQFNTSLLENMIMNNQQQTIKNSQDKQLYQILKQIRIQKYHGDTWKYRSPITVISCLVGWKKAKKILEYELNIIL